MGDYEQNGNALVLNVYPMIIKLLQNKKLMICSGKQREISSWFIPHGGFVEIIY